MTNRAEKVPLRQITLGGEIADQGLLTTLSHKFPSARIVHIYASTEAGVGFAVKDGRAGFPAVWLKNAPSGINIRVDDEGMLYLRADCQHQTYVGQGHGELAGKDGFVCTGDLVKQEGDRFYFLGRSSGTINVGGNKVHPEEVEIVLLGSPEVQLCKVYGKSNAFLGQVVIADIIPSNAQVNHKTLTKQITEYCRDHLQAFKVPAIIHVVDKLEFTGTGKIARI